MPTEKKKIYRSTNNNKVMSALVELLNEMEAMMLLLHQYLQRIVKEVCLLVLIIISKMLVIYA